MPGAGFRTCGAHKPCGLWKLERFLRGAGLIPWAVRVVSFTGAPAGSAVERARPAAMSDNEIGSDASSAFFLASIGFRLGLLVGCYLRGNVAWRRGRRCQHERPKPGDAGLVGCTTGRNSSCAGCLGPRIRPTSRSLSRFPSRGSRISASAARPARGARAGEACRPANGLEGLRRRAGRGHRSPDAGADRRGAGPRRARPQRRPGLAASAARGVLRSPGSLSRPPRQADRGDRTGR